MVINWCLHYKIVEKQKEIIKVVLNGVTNKYSFFKNTIDVLFKSELELWYTKWNRYKLKGKLFK